MRSDYCSILLLSGPGIHPTRLGPLEMASLKESISIAHAVDYIFDRIFEHCLSLTVLDDKFSAVDDVTVTHALGCEVSCGMASLSDCYADVRKVYPFVISDKLTTIQYVKKEAGHHFDPSKANYLYGRCQKPP